MGWHHRYDDSEEEEEEEEEEPSGPPERGEAKKEPLQTAICNAIDAIHGEKAFSSHGKVEHFVDPQLSIDASGPITLPLNRVDASRIIVASHQAPFGRGEETIVDVNVRRTWELNAADFKIQNAAFDHMMSTTIATAATALGVADPQDVKGELYKLLLYEPGAMFKPHVDSEKAPGMFGTLVVCLPALHEGGDVVLTHGYSSVKYSTSTCQPSYLSWYADVRHEVTEVKAGYRLVLTYNLIKAVSTSPGSDTKESISPARFPQLCDALQKWLKLEAPQVDHKAHRRQQFDHRHIPEGVEWYSELIYVLHHEYTEDSLAFGKLKAADLDRAKVIDMMGRELGFTVLLATTERFIHSGEEETFEDHTELRKVFDLDGRLLVSKLPTREECFLQADTFDDGREPDDNEHEGYTGNAGAEDKFWYRNTALVFVRTDILMSFLLRAIGERGRRDTWRKYGDDKAEPKQSAATLISAWANKSEAQPENDLSKYQLRSLCDHVLHKDLGALKTFEADTSSYRYYSPEFGDVVMGSVMQASVVLQDSVMLRNALRCVRDQIPESGFSAVLEAVEKQYLCLGDVYLALNNTINKLSTLAERYEYVKRALTESFGSESTTLKSWATETLTIHIEQMVAAQAEDGAAAARLLIEVQDQPDVVQRIVNAAQRVMSNMNRANFAVALLGMLAKQANPLSEQLRASTIDVLLPSASLDITIQVEQAPRHTMTLFSLNKPPPPPKPTRLTKSLGELLAALASYCASSEKPYVYDTFIPKMMEAAFCLDARQYGRAYMPTVKALFPIITSATEPKRTQLGILITAILEQYVQRFVGTQPASTTSWARPSVNCNCNICAKLNPFLNNPYERVGRFPLSKDSRHHMHAKLDLSRSDCSHITDRNTYPETLVVTKKLDQATKQFDLWKERCDAAATELRDLPQDLLRQALREHFDRIRNMWDVVVDYSRAPEGLQRPPLQPLQQNAAPASAGNKRKAEENLASEGRRGHAPTIIDLCDSD